MSDLALKSSSDALLLVVIYQTYAIVICQRLYDSKSKSIDIYECINDTIRKKRASNKRKKHIEILIAHFLKWFCSREMKKSMGKYEWIAQFEIMRNFLFTSVFPSGIVFLIADSSVYNTIFFSSSSKKNTICNWHLISYSHKIIKDFSRFGSLFMFNPKFDRWKFCQF